MAIKTQTELVTQSDNTFFDNTTGQIIPTNHRLWNEDVLETMFEGIAGRVVTKSEFDALVANSELVVGCVYRITDYPLPTGNAEIYVTAKTSSEIYGQAYCYVFDSYHLLIIDSDGSDAKVLLTLGKGVNAFSGELYNYIDNLIPSSFYEYGADYNFLTASGAGNYYTFQGKIASTFPDTILNHNIYGSYEAPSQYNRYKGFLPDDQFNNRKYFYPDHGTETSWGDYGTNNSGTFGNLEFMMDNPYSGSFTNFSEEKGYFQKVNNIVSGHITCKCDYDGNNRALQFALPFVPQGTPTIIGSGVAVLTNYTHKYIVCDFNYVPLVNGHGSAECYLYITSGSHSQTDEINISFSFSYSLGY